MAPAVAGGYVYVGSCAGVFCALDTATGDVRWRFDAAADGASLFHGNPLIRDTVILVGTDSGMRGTRGWLYALNRLNGELLWKVRADPGLPSNLCARDSLAYAVTYTGRLIAVDMQTGRQVWAFEGIPESDSLSAAKPEGESRPARRFSPVVYRDRVLYVDPDSTVYCLDAGSGTLSWSHKENGRITSRLCLVHDAVAFGTDDGHMVYLDAAGGARIQEQSLEVIPVRGMAYVNGDLVFLGRHAKDPPRYVVAVDPTDGAIRWQASLEGHGPQASWYSPRIHVWKDNAIVGSTSGWLAAYALQDGALSWGCQLQGRIRGIGHGPGMLYVGTYEGMLYALKDVE